MVTFRPASEADIDVIEVLADRIWRAHYPGIISQEQIDFMLADRYSPRAIEEGMKRGERYFLALDKEKAVAYASFERQDNVYFLHKFYNEAGRQRQGLGAQLFRYLLQQMDEPLPIKLQVNRANFKAVNFYFKMGFLIEAVGDFPIGGGFYMNDFVMVRKP
jgi:diamine N-acetyltransferase